MGIDKKLEIVFDLASLNEDQASQLIKANEGIIKKSEQEKKKKKKEKQLDDKERKKEEKESDKKLDEQKETKDDLKTLDIVKKLPSLDQLPQSGLNFFVKQFTKSLPIIGPIIAASSFFINELLKLDVLDKKFLDIADTRINTFVDRQQQALLDNHLEQIIYTTKAGTAAPRDSYNSFNNYDRVLRIEGRDRDASSIGGVD